MDIYTHGYTHFASEEHARQYAIEHIKRNKENEEARGEVCSDIVETVKYKGNKEIHIFSFTYPYIPYYDDRRRLAKVSTRYVVHKLP